MQEIEKHYNEMYKWAVETGIYPVLAPSINLEKITSVDYKATQLMPIEELEELIDKIVAFNIYTRSQKSSIEAQIEIISATVDREIAIETNALDSDYKFKTKEEKKAVIRKLRSDIDSECIKLTTLRAQLMRIKDIPYGVDKKIDILKAIYNRRLQNERRQP